MPEKYAYWTLINHRLLIPATRYRMFVSQIFLS